ncbi:PDR/VanB family oxidoreductase [Arthrobacter oryzae]|uniref:Oxidoreductase n=1 Tax=Arthrobacter oryzae TaxID=409290 RepID=A0A3N0BVF3_9MICC|nr:PDR/VanB family oxidoreductase [Arthrobacter oryzae]RNL53087.1 oxidoreductase [Arthrobacter oryzae]
MSNEFFDVEVRAMRTESDCVVSVHLEHPLGEDLPDWDPGSHIDVLLPNGILRQYSLCSGPDEARDWRLGVLREPQGRGGSAFVHSELVPGTKLQVRGPRNNFPLLSAEKYLFIAGGIGITAILPMVRDAARKGIPWRLLYLGRSRSSMAFLEEVQALGGNATVHAHDESGLYPLAGLVARPESGTRVYACGPQGLLDMIEQASEDWSDPSAYHFERFVAAVDAEPGDKSGGSSFVVELADGTEVEVGAEVSILRALEDAGINQLNSCREGICGTCETGVISGDIDHRDSLLSAEERAAGDTMMICVSRCKGLRLILDL